MNENWKAIPGWEGRYEVSNMGRVRSLNRTVRSRVFPGKILSQRVNKQGYLYVGLSSHSKVVSYKVHRLVALAFIENSNGETCIDHIDRDKLNNRAENLRWCTLSDNQNNPLTLKYRRERIESGVYTRKGVAVKQLNLDGELIQSFNSIYLAEKATGLHHATIRKRCYMDDNVWGGYRWEFVDPHHKEIVEASNSTYRKAVARISDDGERKVYESISQAARENNIKSTNISGCINGCQKTAGGYGWILVKQA